MGLPIEIAQKVDLIHQDLRAYYDAGMKIFSTSSFQTHSIPLLHIISQLEFDVPIYMTNTGFLFPDTLAFRDQIAKDLNLEVISIRSTQPKLQQRDRYGNFYYTSDPDYCCHINKVSPLEAVLAEFDIWVNGIRADQSKHRSGMSKEQDAPFGVKRYHPVLDWNSKMIYQYRSYYGLPEHPMEVKGYFSIGCEPCTQKYDAKVEGRQGRWKGLKKTECGLHTELVK